VNEAGRRRAAPLSPEQRREAIIEATLPLLRAEGINVSTRKIAECAGIAEGTIFRAFPDKQALIHATLARAFDPAPTIESLKAIAGDPDLRFRLRTAVRMIMRKFKDNLPLIMALRTSGIQVTPSDAREGMSHLVRAVADLLEPDQHRLRLPAESTAWLLMSMIMGRGAFAQVSEEQMVTVLLDGVLFPEVEEESSHADKTPPPASAAL
jgi:AcrR family transcriptional regulator